MKATSTQIQDLQQDITSLDRTLSRHPNEHTALNLKGCKLIELAKALNNPSYYDEALICFNEAIRLTNEENDGKVGKNCTAHKRFVSRLGRTAQRIGVNYMEI